MLTGQSFSSSQMTGSEKLRMGFFCFVFGYGLGKDTVTMVVTEGEGVRNRNYMLILSVGWGRISPFYRTCTPIGLSSCLFISWH